LRHSPAGSCPISAALFRDKLEQRGRVYEATTWPEQVPGCPASACLIRLPGLLPASAIASPCRDFALSLRAIVLKIVKIEYRAHHPSFTLTCEIRRRRPQLSHSPQPSTLHQQQRLRLRRSRHCYDFYARPQQRVPGSTSIEYRRWPQHSDANPAALPIPCRSLCRAVTISFSLRDGRRGPS
jgi:hypothetical protein